MVKHIILWQLKDELSAAEKAEIKANIKTGLEGLAGQIPGLVEVHVNINGLPSSNADLMLDNISGFYMTASGNLFFKDVKVG